MTKVKATLKVLKVILKHKATYRFLAVLLGAIGVQHSEALSSGLETILCAIADGCH